MSSILLSNPFVSAQPSAQPTAVEPQMALAVAPAASAGSSNSAGNAMSHSGNGSGFGSGPGQHAIFTEARSQMAAQTERPVDATPGSIVNAQAQADPLGNNLPEVEMPDPLPTSPFLKRLSEGA